MLTPVDISYDNESNLSQCGQTESMRSSERDVRRKVIMNQCPLVFCEVWLQTHSVVYTSHSIQLTSYMAPRCATRNIYTKWGNLDRFPQQREIFQDTAPEREESETQSKPPIFSEFLKNFFPPTQISDASSISAGHLINYKNVIRIWIYEITWPHLAWGRRRICIDWIVSFWKSQFITQWAPSVTYPLTPKVKLNWRH